MTQLQSARMGIVTEAMKMRRPNLTPHPRIGGPDRMMKSFLSLCIADNQEAPFYPDIASQTQSITARQPPRRRSLRFRQGLAGSESAREQQQDVSAAVHVQRQGCPSSS